VNLIFLSAMFDALSAISGTFISDVRDLSAILALLSAMLEIYQRCWHFYQRFYYF